MFKNVLPNVGINSCQGIIQQVNRSLLVHGPSKVHPLLLPSREIDSLENILTLFIPKLQHISQLLTLFCTEAL